MEPKEKAKELFDKMKGFRVKHFHSKRCALIAVDEILKIEVLHRKIQWAEWNNVQPDSIF